MGLKKAGSALEQLYRVIPFSYIASYMAYSQLAAKMLHVFLPCSSTQPQWLCQRLLEPLLWHSLMMQLSHFIHKVKALHHLDANNSIEKLKYK